MIRKLYCIYDFKAEAPVNGIFQTFSNDDEAKRMFTRVVTSQNAGLVSDHPGDFGLLFVGEVNFDDLSIKLNPNARGIPVITGDACVRAFERARAEMEARKDPDNQARLALG